MSERDYAEIFSKNLRRMMEQRDMTQLELSKRLGVSSASVNNWVSGTKNPRMDKVDKMCEIFGCKRSDLMQEHTEEEPYYHDPESRDLANFLFENPEYKLLFSACRKVKKEDLEFVREMIDRMQR